MSEGVDLLRELVQLTREIHFEIARRNTEELSQTNYKIDPRVNTEIETPAYKNKTEFVIHWIKEHNAQNISTRKIVDKISEEGISVSHSLVGKAKKVMNEGII